MFLRNIHDLPGGYDLGRALCITYRTALDGLRELEHDLHQHIHVKNAVLCPRALVAA